MTDSIHVTHIVSGDLWAGAEVQAYQIGKALREHTNITPRFILFNEGLLAKALRESGIETHVFEERKISPITLISSVRKLITQQRTHILHTHGYKENIVGNLARLSSPVKYSVRTEHGSAEHHYSWRQWPQKIIHGLDRFIGKHYQQKIIAVSKQLEKELTPIYGHDKVIQLYNAIDTQSLKGIPKSRSTSNPVQPVIKIAFAARLVPVKRIDIFIESMSLLKKSTKHEFEAHIFGDGPLLSDAKHLASITHNPEIFNFHGFTSPLPPELEGMDILVICSDHEGLPMTLLEAISMGVIPVCHSVGGMKEILINNQDGLLVDEHTPTAFSTAIDTLLSDEKNREVISKNAEKKAHTQFDITNVITEYSQLYQAIFNRNK